MKRTKASDALAELIKDVLIMAALAEKAGNVLAASFGLTYARWQMLGQLDSTSEPCTVSHHARLLGQSRQAVQRICNELAKLGLVTFSRNAGDRRADFVTLTAQGSKTYRKSYDDVAWFTHAVSAELNAARIELARDVVKSVTGRFLVELEAMEERPDPSRRRE